MPRYKEYNEDRVTEKAMYKFWVNGFGATSLEDLTKEMKINKFSFYDTFESKDNLLIKTMEYYYRKFLRPKLNQLQENKNILNFLLSFLTPDEKGLSGCFILSVTSETGKTIPEAVEILDEYISEVKKILRDIFVYYHQDSSWEDQNIKTQQLLGLCTCIPMVYSLRPVPACRKYIETILTRLDMNKQPDYAS